MVMIVSLVSNIMDGPGEGVRSVEGQVRGFFQHGEVDLYRGVELGGFGMGVRRGGSGSEFYAHVTSQDSRGKTINQRTRFRWQPPSLTLPKMGVTDLLTSLCT